MRGSIRVGAACVGLAAASLCAQPVGTAFTYQGEIKESGTPANGAFDFQFKLYSVPSGGTQSGPTICADASVTDGRFTLELDFGSQFLGQKRYMEVAVRADPGGTTPCSTTSGYTTLTPRQEVTPAPYAITSALATNALLLNNQGPSFYLNAANLSGTLSGAALGGTYSNAISLTSASNAFTGNGAGLTSLSASNLAAGTVPDARLSTNVALLTGSQTFTGTKAFNNPLNSFVGMGSNLTLLNASNLASGTVNDARLSANIPRLGSSNTFTGPTNSFTGDVHSATSGFRFPDNSVQVTAALDPGNFGFISGYPAGTTVTVSLNGTVFPTARMIGELTLERNGVNQATWDTLPSIRRPRTADNTWYEWARNQTVLSGFTLTVATPGGASVVYAFPPARLGEYRLITGDDNLPFEEVLYVPGSSTIGFSIVTVSGSLVGILLPSVTPRLGESTGTTPGSTYRSVWNNVRNDSISVIGNLDFAFPINTSTGNPSASPQPGTVAVRLNALGDALNLDNAFLTNNTRTFRLVIHPPAGPDINCTNNATAAFISMTVRIADDGFPVEEYEVEFPMTGP